MFLKDENVIVLDFLSTGHAAGRKEAIAQVIGEKYFSLLEIIIKPGVNVKNGDKLYIGEGKREIVDHIKRRINSNELTSFAKSEIPFLVARIVNENEAKFVEIFNTAHPVSTRMHQLELLPGIGKKHMWSIIEERKKGKFKNFEDIKTRINLIPDPKGSIVKRIIQEIENEDERYRLFVAGKPREY